MRTFPERFGSGTGLRGIDMTDTQRIEILEKHVNALAEIYDAVQVVGTFLDADGRTRGQKRGSGNWYARRALCQEFIEQAQANDLADEIARKLEPPEDWKSE